MKVDTNRPGEQLKAVPPDACGNIDCTNTARPGRYHCSDDCRDAAITQFNDGMAGDLYHFGGVQISREFR